MATYGEQFAFFSDEPYRVVAELNESQQYAIDEKAYEAASMEAFEIQRRFGQGVLETVGV